MSALYIAAVQWVPCSELRLRDATASKEVGRPHLLFGFGNVVLGENLCICFFCMRRKDRTYFLLLNVLTCF